jgi:beta-lactamase class A
MRKPEQKLYQSQYYSSVHRTGPPSGSGSSKRGRGRRIVLYVVIVALLAGGTYALLHNGDQTVAHAIKSATTSKQSDTKDTASSPALNTMGQTINGVISNNSNVDMSVNLINLNTNQAEHYGTNDTFQAASTAKLITAGDWLHEVENGQQSMSETIGGYTAQYELQQMIVVSDDTAWANLNNTLTYPNLQTYADTLGLTDYQAYNNSLNSTDIALVLQKLWDGTLLNPSDTQLLLSYMKQANYREYIVPAIPAQDTIYHKIGLYEDYVNDAAIVTHGKQTFAIVIFTNGNGVYNWPARATMMQDITKAALKYYFNQ